MEHAKDLQIGDWVQGVDSMHVAETFVQVDAIEEGQTCILVKRDNANWFLDIEWLEPIPLTAEILENNGFEKIPCGFGDHLFGLTDDYYVVGIKEYTEGIWQVEYTNREMNFPLCRNLVCNVHELQHALRLCGIEKEIVL